MNFTELVRQNMEESLKTAPAAEASFRQHAWDAFTRLQLPDRSNEAWKYSSLQSLVQTAWKMPTTGTIPAIARDLAAQFQDRFSVLILHNGQIQGVAPNEFKITARALAASPQLNYDDGFISAAAAVNRGGFDLEIADHARPARPMLLVHVQDGEQSWNSTLNRILIGQGAQVQLAEIFVSPASQYLRTDITRAQIAEGASVEWVRLQQEAESASYFAEVQAHLSANARLALTQLNSGAQWSRTSLKIDIHGTGAEAQISGLSFGRGEQHVDQRVQVSHHVGQSSSSQLFKGVLKDRARGVLNGKIYIARDAQRVVSNQLNHNLLLGSGAEADTKPELEIYADDVKANHGASIGRLDEEKMFYLLSRGIPRAQAERMLARAFVGDVIMKIGSRDLRELVETRVAGLLPGFLAEYTAGGES